MRLTAALLLALALLVPTPAAAQEPSAAAVALLEDPAGDVEAYANGSPATAVPAGNDLGEALDLRGLAAQETPLEVLLTLSATSVDPGALSVLAIEYLVQFRHVDVTYQLSIFAYTNLGGGPPMYAGELTILDASGFGSHVASVPVTADQAAGTMTAALPRAALVDAEGAAPFPGRTLDGFRASAGYLEGASLSLGSAGQSPLPYVADHMPDEGEGLVPLPIVHGLAQTGALRLSSEEPFRASNGEASTFVFRVNATNVGGDEHVASFAVAGAPASWEVRTPELVRLPPGETVELPIVVRTAFAHAHGSSTALTLELASQDDPGSVGRIQIGLRYPAIAQPAGHHNELYLHNIDTSDDPVFLALGTALGAVAGGDGVRFPYVNTAPPEADEQDDKTPVTGQYCGLRVAGDNDTVGSSYCWRAPLLPALEMGLDFDLAAEGAYSIPIHSMYPQPGARVEGRIVYYAPLEQSDDPFAFFFQEPIVVAELLASERTDLLVNQGHVFTGVIKATEEGELIPYARGAGLELQVELLNARPDNFYLGPKLEPQLSPGGFLRLPLLEYEDPVDEAYAAASALHLVLDGDSRRDANPGDTVVYTVTLHNADAQAHDVALALVGSNREWGTLLDDDGFRLDADGGRTVRIAVTVPADALDEDRADLVLEAASRDDLSARALLRLVTTVDTDAEHADDAALLAGAAAPKDAPAGAASALALAVLGLAGLARRRHR